MSVVSNCILKYSLVENKGKEKEINKYFGNGIGFVNVESKSLPHGWYGGSKFLECIILLGAINNFDYMEFIEYLKTLKWKRKEYLQLMIQCQDDDRFKIINIFDEGEID